MAFTYIPPTQNLYKGGTQFSLSTSIFQTTSTVDSEGESTKLDENSSFTLIESNILAGYGFTQAFSLYAGGRFRQVTTEFQSDTTNEAITVMGLDAYLLQMRFTFAREKGSQYAFVANYSNTPYENEEFTSINDVESVELGDEGQDVSVGLSFSNVIWGHHFISGQFLYRNPGENLSNEFLSQLEFALVWEKLSFFVGVENVTSFNQDPYTTDPENKPQINSVVTNRFNSINREWTAPYGGLIFGLGKNWAIQYQLKGYVIGQSTDLGMEHMVTLVRRSDPPDVFKQKDKAFKQYQYEGNVSKISNSSRTCIVDMGMAKGLEKGMRVDFFYFDYLGANELIASGVVVKAQVDSSIIKIDARYSSKRELKVGTVARAGLIRN